MRRPIYEMRVFKERRQTLAARMGKGAALILHANPELIRNSDVHYPYRQDSNFFYLTGFEEPESILVFRPGQVPETVMFVRPKDVMRETWDGFRYGPEGTEREFHIDKTYLLADFEKMIVDLLKPAERLYHRWQINADVDRQIIDILGRVRVSHGRTGRGHLPVYDASELIGEMRLFKTADDVKVMKKACLISCEAHVEAMKFTRPGVGEKQLMGVILGTFFMQNADREGYGSIVASGANATTLHYVFNDQTCRDGDLILIDAGAEYQFYTGDITRTYPVNGRFSAAQRRVYDRVLEVQKSLIARVKPGLVFKTLQESTIEALTDIMIDLGLLKGSRAERIQDLSYRRYYPHGVSHWLGMDVHDAGLYLKNSESRALEPGMSFTIEPGLYIPADDASAPEELRGIGIRIEDNILVTASGCDNLTEAAPKEVKDIEAVVGTRAK